MTLKDCEFHFGNDKSYNIYISNYNTKYTQDNLYNKDIFQCCYMDYDGYDVILFQDFDSNKTISVHEFQKFTQTLDNSTRVVSYDYDDYHDIELNHILFNTNMGYFVLCI